MAFLSGLFDRKVGGTLVGNLVRNVASHLSGGVLGQGQMMLTQEEADKKSLTDAQFLAKYGKTKAGATSTDIGKIVGNAAIGLFTGLPTPIVSTSGVPSTATPPIVPNVLGAVQQTVSKVSETAGESAVRGALKKYWWLLLLPLGTIAFVLLYKRKK